MRTVGLYCSRLCIVLLACLLQWGNGALLAQNKVENETQLLPKAQMRRERIQKENPDTLWEHRNTVNRDSLRFSESELPDDTIALQNQRALNALEAPADTTIMQDEAVLKLETLENSSEKEKKVFIPDPVKATWLAAVFPGGGQIYNRKYWKLPIIYGGFVGCAYALSWNGQMYSDYSQAYLDIMDDSPETDSYLDMLPPGYNVEANIDYLKKVIKRKKDYYRRYRDMSIFIFIGVYAISIIDAYVDAELASFDISKDLTLKMSPAVIDSRDLYTSRRGTQSYGVQCRFQF
ncbi:MAG: hypothetical protein IJ417_04175 [Bacteroidaceae bacterium]|nr:hypothetical protein [Bacteroidaceae bacterium]